MKEAAKRLVRYNEIKAWLEKYERALMPAMLITGVAADFITFRNISIKSAFILLTVHLILAGLIITFVNAYDNDRMKKIGRLTRYPRLAAPFILQLNFGALLSASFIFYWFSGSFSVSWPILIAIAILMASNDVFREQFQKPIAQLCVYSFILFSFFSLILPFLFNSIKVWVFVVSGLLGLALAFAFNETLARFIYPIRQSRSTIISIIILIYTSMFGLYFLNIIPPIPLSIRDAGVFHQVSRSTIGYVVKSEDYSLIDQIIPGKTLHLTQNDRAYIYSSIFAPAKLNATIAHEWYYFDPELKEWVQKDRLTFLINGGRESGYRGYSFKTGLAPGNWRVNIETARGQVLGRVKFKIQQVPQEPELIEIIKN